MVLGIVLGIIVTTILVAIYLRTTDRLCTWQLPHNPPPSLLKKFSEWWRGLSRTERQVWTGMVMIIAILIWILGLISPGFRLAIWVVWLPFLGVGGYQFYKRG